MFLRACDGGQTHRLENDVFPEVEKNDRTKMAEAILANMYDTGFEERAEELLDYARMEGLHYIMPSAEDLANMVTFLQAHPLIASENCWRRHRLEDIQVILEGEFLKIDAFLRNAEMGIYTPEILKSLRHVDSLEERLQEILRLAESAQNPATLLRPEAEISGGHFAAVLPALQSACASLKRFLRYMFDQYHGGRFGVEFVSAFLGFANVEDFLWKKDGARRLVIDFGCGNADLLVETARAVRRRVRGREFLDEYIKLLRKEKILIGLTDDNLLKLVYRDFISHLNQANLNLRHPLEPLDPHLVGVDEAEITLEELRFGHGISTSVADVCDRNFFAQTGLEQARAEVAISILTLDRVYDLDAFLQNFSGSLADGGRFLLANKGIIDTRSDGQGVTILYRIENDLKGENYRETLEKLRPKLAQYGLIVDTIAVHPYAVISTEGVQYYDLVLVGGGK